MSKREASRGRCLGCARHLFKPMRYKAGHKVIDICELTGQRIYCVSRKKCSRFDPFAQSRIRFGEQVQYRGFDIEPYRRGGHVMTNAEGRWWMNFDDVERCKDWADGFLDRPSTTHPKTMAQ